MVATRLPSGETASIRSSQLVHSTSPGSSRCVSTWQPPLNGSLLKKPSRSWATLAKLPALVFTLRVSSVTVSQVIVLTLKLANDATTMPSSKSSSVGSDAKALTLVSACSSRS